MRDCGKTTKSSIQKHSSRRLLFSSAAANIVVLWQWHYAWHWRNAAVCQLARHVTRRSVRGWCLSARFYRMILATRLKTYNYAYTCWRSAVCTVTIYLIGFPSNGEWVSKSVSSLTDARMYRRLYCTRISQWKCHAGSRRSSRCYFSSAVCAWWHCCRDTKTLGTWGRVNYPQVYPRFCANCQV